MALKPTIYKAQLHVSDLNRQVYRTESQTIALHPSETLTRMVSRLIAYCLNVSDELTFTKGLSTTDEPDLWEKSLDDQIVQWIEMGEPGPDRLKKATRLAQKVKVYSYNTKSDVWFGQDQDKFGQLDLDIIRFNADEIEQLSKSVERTMQWYVTISENTASITTDSNECSVSWEVLQQSSDAAQQ